MSQGQPATRRNRFFLSASLALVLLALVLLAPLRGARAIPAAQTGFRVLYRAGDTNATDNQLKPHLNVVNGTTGSVPLSELKLRYWFTPDTTSAIIQFNCDYAFLGCGNLSASFPGSYMEVRFNGGSLNAGGQTGEMQLRLNKSDWSNFNERDDYSFDPSKTTYAEHSKVTLYRRGTLVWGVEPGGQPSPTWTSTARPTNTSSPTAPPSPTSTAHPTETATATNEPSPETATATNEPSPETATATNEPLPSIVSEASPTATRTTNTTVQACVLLKNCNFEFDTNANGKPDSWVGYGALASSSFSRSNVLRYNGTYSLRHSSSVEATYSVSQIVADISGGSSYTFSGWTNIPPTDDVFTYRIELIWRNEANAPLRTDLIRSYNAATSGWSFAKATRSAPDDATNVVVRMSVGDFSSTIYADAFNLRPAITTTPTTIDDL